MLAVFPSPNPKYFSLLLPISFRLPFRLTFYASIIVDHHRRHEPLSPFVERL